MNYYERHIGDYLKDTAHLSLLEHGVYSRLLDVYYTREEALPDDLSAVARLIGARSKDEKEALAAVLEEFFLRTDTGWSQIRSDREIARFKDKQEKAKRSAEARWNPKQQQSVGNANASDIRHADDMRTHCEGNAPRHQTPDTSNQTPDTRPEDKDTLMAVGANGPENQRVSMAGAVCLTLKAEGIPSVNPGHPDLIALLAQGAEVQNFVSAARTARDKGKGFAYVLGIVKGQMADANALAAAGQRSAPPRAQTTAERRTETIAGLTGRTTERTNDAIRTPIAIDVDARVVE